MMKITIEIDGAQAQLAVPPGAPTAHPPADATSAPAGILAKAAASGAHNAGQAPSLGTAGVLGPVASSIGGAADADPSGAASAGAAPDVSIGVQS
jgi:hypothetical protein